MVVDSMEEMNGPLVAASALNGAENAMTKALALRRWWEQVDASDGYRERSQLMQTYNAPDKSFSFYGMANLGARDLPVMGEVEERIFDQPKGTNIEGVRRELREFVLRYLLRVSDFRKPSAFVMEKNRRPAGCLRRLNFCQDETINQKGFGFSQWYHKKSDNGVIGRFADDKRFEITDLREIGKTFDWIMLGVKIFDFTFTFTPFGQNLPQLTVPLEESSFLMICPEFIVDQSGLRVMKSGERVIGQYGFGYGFVPNPTARTLGYGPGEFEVAFQHIHFRLLENGRVHVQLVFVANRLQKVVNVPLDPIRFGLNIADWASFGVAKPALAPLRLALNKLPSVPLVDPITSLIDLVNFVTVGEAGRILCISRRRLEQVFLIRHFLQHHDMINGALQTWRGIEDWTDEALLPEWVKTGVSS